MKVVVLGSGSKGNCTYLETKNTKVLIDAGLSVLQIRSRLRNQGIEFSNLDAVFITHEHADHIAGLCTLLKNYSVPVHMTEPSYIAFTRGKGFEYRDRIVVHEVEYVYNVGALTVSSCEVSHDSAACVSLLVTGEAFSFCSCTDLGCITERVLEHVSRAENVILESNHDLTLLSIGSYPDDLKRRIRSKNGHLSNDQCDSVLVRLARGRTKRVLLAHISPENNTGEIALHAAISELEKAGVELEFIDVAQRLSPVRLL